jgi:hypothetical protein
MLHTYEYKPISRRPEFRLKQDATRKRHTLDQSKSEITVLLCLVRILQSRLSRSQGWSERHFFMDIKGIKGSIGRV